WNRLRRQGEVDLAAVEHGGFVVACSDMFFGSRHNLIMPGDATHMGDGWETKRRRGPGHDWTIIRLGAAGSIRRVEVDTRHFKGNAPGACSLEGSTGPSDDQSWRTLLTRTPLLPHARHVFEDELRGIGDATHVRFNIFPDGWVGLVAWERRGALVGPGAGGCRGRGRGHAPQARRGEPRVPGPVWLHLHRLCDRQDGRRDARHPRAPVEE